MKLKRVHVRNYRSITDSGEVSIEDGVTVLIGKNEQGKTNFLRALASFNEDKAYSPSDLPNHLRPSLEEMDPQKIPIVDLYLSPGAEEKASIGGLVQDLEMVELVKCVKYYGNNYSFSATRTDGSESPLVFKPPEITQEVDAIHKIASSLKEKLTAHAARLAAFTPSKEQALATIDGFLTTQLDNGSQISEVAKTLTTALKGLPGQDTAIQEDISSATKEIDAFLAKIRVSLQTDASRLFRDALPYFVFHSTKVDQIPNEVTIAQFIQEPEATSRGMVNLCRAAGLSIQKIRQLASTTDTAQRESYEDHHQGTISGGLNEFWTQETYHVHFRISNEKLSVSVSDETYSRRIQPSDRSEGFQWYLSFYCTLLNEISSARTTVLLLDNPGIELHVHGQRDIKRFLEYKMSFDSQIIYVTHSPAMIDPFNLSQLRRVDLLPNQEGTKVSPVIKQCAEDFDLMEPVRSAIGTNLAASLMLNDFNVLVEGASDKPILDASFRVLHVDESAKMLINGSISESKECILARFYARTKLPFIILLDADSGGRDLEAELKKWGIPDTHIVMLSAIISKEGKDFALEDVVSSDFYYGAVTRAYPANPIDRPEDKARKRVKAYEDAFRSKHGIGFSKRRVAEIVGKAIMQGEMDAETKENMKKVTDALLNRLRAQSDRDTAGMAEDGVGAKS